MSRKLDRQRTLIPKVHYDDTLTEQDLGEIRSVIARLLREVPPLELVDIAGLALEGAQVYLEMEHLPKNAGLCLADSNALRESAFNGVARADAEFLKRAGFLPAEELAPREVSAHVENCWRTWTAFLDAVRENGRRVDLPLNTREGRLLRHYRGIRRKQVVSGQDALDTMRVGRLKTTRVKHARPAEMTHESLLGDYLTLCGEEDGPERVLYVNKSGRVAPGSTRVRDALRRAEGIRTGELGARSKSLHDDEGNLRFHPVASEASGPLEVASFAEEVQRVRDASHQARDLQAASNARQGSGAAEAAVRAHLQDLLSKRLSLQALSDVTGISKSTLGDAYKRVRMPLRKSGGRRPLN